MWLAGDGWAGAKWFPSRRSQYHGFLFTRQLGATTTSFPSWMVTSGRQILARSRPSQRQNHGEITKTVLTCKTKDHRRQKQRQWSCQSTRVLWRHCDGAAKLELINSCTYFRSPVLFLSHMRFCRTYRHFLIACSDEIETIHCVSEKFNFVVVYIFLFQYEQW